MVNVIVKVNVIVIVKVNVKVIVIVKVNVNNTKQRTSQPAAMFF